MHSKQFLHILYTHVPPKVINDKKLLVKKRFASSMIMSAIFLK